VFFIVAARMFGLFGVCKLIFGARREKRFLLLLGFSEKVLFLTINCY